MMKKCQNDLFSDYSTVNTLRIYRYSKSKLNVMFSECDEI